MKIEKRTWTDKNNIEHHSIDYYSNAKCLWMACRKIAGTNKKEDVLEFLESFMNSENLIIMDGGTNGRYYICWID